MSQENDLQDKLIEIEKYILDPTRNPDLVADKIRLDKLSKRRKAYRERKLKSASIKSDSEDVKKATPKKKKSTPVTKKSTPVTKNSTPVTKKFISKNKNKKVTPNTETKSKVKKKSSTKKTFKEDK